MGKSNFHSQSQKARDEKATGEQSDTGLVGGMRKERRAGNLGNDAFRTPAGGGRRTGQAEQEQMIKDANADLPPRNRD